MTDKCKKCGREDVYLWEMGKCEHCIKRDMFQSEKWAQRRETIGMIGFIALIIFLIVAFFFEI